MFNLIPFTGAGRKMTNAYFHAGFIRECLKFFSRALDDNRLTRLKACNQVRIG